jgi:hypothetical protein
MTEHLDHASNHDLTPDKMVFKEAKSRLITSAVGLMIG